MVRHKPVETPPWRLLSSGLLAVAVVICVPVDLVLLSGYPVGVDAEIPLRAAQRWVSGQLVYDPDAFHVTGGPELPFLYPPAVLPILAPLLELPRPVTLAAWLAATLAAAVLGLRRLGLGWLWVAAMLLWPPFLEAVLAGNVQLLLFLALVFLFYPAQHATSATAVGDPRSIDLAADSRRPHVAGLLAAFIASVKVSQLHAFAHLAPKRPRAAAIGIVTAAAIALLAVAATGPQAWVDWLNQAGRSGDPDWKPVGIPLSTLVGRPFALAVTVITVVGAMAVRGPRAGAWVGLLTVVGSPSVHLFGFVFLVPAILSVPVPVGLVAVILVATGGPAGAWTGVLILGVALLAVTAMERIPGTAAVTTPR
jgi:hypothetical protein